MINPYISYQIFHYGDEVVPKKSIARLLEKTLNYKNNTLWAADLDFILDDTKIFSKENRGCYVVAKEKEQPVGSLCMCNIKFWIDAEQNDRPGIDRDHLLPKIIWERYAKRNDVACYGDLLTVDTSMREQLFIDLVTSMEKFCKAHDYLVVYLHIHSDSDSDQALSFWRNAGYQLILQDGTTAHFEKNL